MRDCWITLELASGLQKLLCLSLEGQPAAETIGGTLAAWREVLGYRRAWNEDRDVPRFRAAFIALGARCRRWPTPADFVDALPRIEIGVPRLSHVASDATRDANLAKIDALLGQGSPS